MKDSTIVVGKNHHYIEPSIRINSISIDLGSGSGKDGSANSKKCEHFSMRGYVSEMRKRDWKRCSPFQSDDNSGDDTCTLPPLLVPKFRWWCCRNCVREKSAEGATSGYDIQQAPSENSVKGKAVDPNTSTSPNQRGIHTSCGGKKEKKFGFASNFMGNNTGSDNIMIKESPLLPDGADAAAEVTCSIIREKQHKAGMGVCINTDSSKSVESRKIGSGSHDAFRNELTDRSLHSMDGNSKAKCQSGNRIAGNDRHAGLMTVLGSSAVAGVVDEAPYMLKRHTREHPSVDEGDNTSFGNCETLNRNRPEDDHNDNVGGMHHRKFRKVRLLSDLLGKSEDTSVDVASDALPNALLSATKDQLPHVGIVTRELGLDKKRKLTQDDKWSPREKASSFVYEKDRIFNRNEQTTSPFSSCSNDNASPGVYLQWTNQHGFDRVPIKKRDKSQVDEGLALALSHVCLQKDAQRKIGNPNKGNIFGKAIDSLLSKSTPSEFGRGSVPCSVHALETERISNLSKKRSKMTPLNDAQAALISWNSALLGGSLAPNRDPRVLQNNPLTVPCQPGQDPFAGKRQDFYLNSSLGQQRYDKQVAPQPKNGLSSLLCCQKNNIRKGGHVPKKDTKRNCVTDMGFPLKYDSAPHVQTGPVSDISNNSTIRQIPFLNEKQNYTRSPVVEPGSCSLVQQKDTCGGSSNLKTVGTQEHSSITRKNGNKRAKSDRLLLDDVPMEIVELMAKNQYERCHPDVGQVKQPVQETNNVRKQLMDLNKVYGTGNLNLLQENAAKIMPQPNVTNVVRNSEVTRGEKVFTGKQKSAAYFSHADQNHHNTNRLRQPYATAGIVTFPQNRASPLQYPATIPSGASSSQSFPWTGNMVGKRPPPSNFSPLTACNRCQSTPQQYKDVHPWSSMVQNQISFAYGAPQNRADQSTRLDVPSCSTGSDKINGQLFFNSSVLNHEKQTRKIDSETSRRTNSESQTMGKHTGIGSSEMYSNEILPAMHLLSLMDAGRASCTQIDLNGTPELFKKPPLPYDHHSKEFSGIPSGGGCKRPAFDFFGKNSLSQKSYETFPAIPMTGASISFDCDKRLKKSDDITTQVSSKTREKEARQDSNFSTQNRGCRSQEYLFKDGNLDRNAKCVDFHDYGILPLKSLGKFGPQSSNDSLFPVRISWEPEICSINRNPADFPLGEKRDMYMIRGEDLKFRKTSVYGNSSILLSKSKGQRGRKKRTLAKEQP